MFYIITLLLKQWPNMRWISSVFTPKPSRVGWNGLFQFYRNSISIDPFINANTISRSPSLPRKSSYYTVLNGRTTFRLQNLLCACQLLFLGPLGLYRMFVWGMLLFCTKKFCVFFSYFNLDA
uniref:Uncharacterized protein n=1 Tax=Myotis myotis TaxID=51298 RepID=A0A7J7ZXE4_MYOMY|nr:hypothetical protein mMyoMyo1_009696 [Myotis myotis]